MPDGDKKNGDWNNRFSKASQIIDKFNSQIKKSFSPGPHQTVEIEFGDDSVPGTQKSAPIKKLYEPDHHTAQPISQPQPQSQLQSHSQLQQQMIQTMSNEAAEKKNKSYSYEFEGGVLMTCRIDEWGKGFSLFGDFVRDAKKYYKKTCINANYIYYFSYRPMYKELSHEQLCWYLFWRSRIREGAYLKTGLSYIFLYLYEQINLSDIIGCEKVYESIIKIWKNYRAEFPRIDKYIAEWLIDFAFINKIKIDLNDIEDILPSIINIVTIPEIYLRGDFFKNKNNAGLIIKNMSVYDPEKSKFYNEKNKELFDYHIALILNAVLSGAEFEEILKKEIDDGVKVKTTRESYMGAVCAYEYKRRITVEYKNLYKNFFIRQCITDTVRSAENVLRDYLNIKSKLTVTAYPETLRKVIEEYREKYLTAAKAPKITVKNKGKIRDKSRRDEIEEEPETVEFNPNMQAAAEIEKESWDTTMALVELQNRDSQEIPEIVDDDTIDDIVVSEEDDGEFIAIDTGDVETYEELDEIAPDTQTPAGLNGASAEFRSAMASRPTDIDIFDVLENLEMQDNKTEQPAKIDNAGWTAMEKFIASLTEEEHTALEMLLKAKRENKSFDMLCGEYVTRRGEMLESVVDAINEKALDFTGDIVFDITSQEMIEDYVKEIEKYIGIE